MGLYYEEFQLNQQIKTGARTVTEGDIVTFGGLSGDYNPVHMDAAFCAKTDFGERIAHGPMVLSMAIGLMSQENMINYTAIALLNVNWDFKGPVKIGDTIHVLVTPIEKRLSKKPNQGVVILQFEVINQEGAQIQIGTATLLMRTQPND